jgi:hypothetical protein
MKPIPTSPDTEPDDAGLRQTLRASLPTADDRALLALQDRVMTQWTTHAPSAATVRTGPALALVSVLRGSRWQWAAAALVLALALGLQAQRKSAEHSADDLLEPDVLALITMGEL